MTSPQVIELAPAQAAALIRRELAQAVEILQTGCFDATLDRCIRALGIGLQLGPAPTQDVLTTILDIAHALARRQDVYGLSALGPALVALVAQVRDAGVLPATAVMDAWATIAADLGTLIGQLGVALELAPDRRGDMLTHARTRAILLDDATNGLFALATWLDGLGTGEEVARHP